jgi:hypothetical protein
MENHPIYKPQSSFKKKEKLGNDFFRHRYFVWENLENLPNLWTFYEDTNNLTVESKTGKKNLKWSILSHLKLLSIQAQNGEIDQNSNYEIWQSSDNKYCELHGVLDGKIIRLMREDAVEEVYHKDLIRLPLQEITKTEHYQVETYLKKEDELKKQTQNGGCAFYLISSIIVLLFVLGIKQPAIFILYLMSYFVVMPMRITNKIAKLRLANMELAYNQKVLARSNSIGAYFMSNVSAALGGGVVIAVVVVIVVIVVIVASFLIL